VGETTQQPTAEITTASSPTETEPESGPIEISDNAMGQYLAPLGVYSIGIRVGSSPFSDKCILVSVSPACSVFLHGQLEDIRDFARRIMIDADKVEREEREKFRPSVPENLGGGPTGSDCPEAQNQKKGERVEVPEISS